MLYRERRKIVDHLENVFDEETVARVLSGIERNDEDYHDVQIVSALLSGRNASTLFPRVEHALTQDLTLRKFRLISDFLSETQKAELLKQIEILDSTLIEEVLANHYPPIRWLQPERRKAILQTLINLVTSEMAEEDSITILKFLLDFVADPYSHPTIDKQTIELATDWCFQHQENELSLSLLWSLLDKAPSPTLISFAIKQFKSHQWSPDRIFLLSSLIRVGPEVEQRWIDDFFENCDITDLDDVVISAWIASTGCNRRSFKAAQRALSWGAMSLPILSSLLGYMSRKFVRRYVKRFMLSNPHRSGVHYAIEHILEQSPRKANVAIAKQVLNSVSQYKKARFIGEILKCAFDSELLVRAKEIVRSYPNSRMSFELMCQVAKHEPKTAVPWLQQWLVGALPKQKTEALSAVVEYAPTPEHLEQGIDWFGQVEAQGMCVPKFLRIELLCALLKTTSSEYLLERAAHYSNNVSAQTHPNLHRLRRRLATAKEIR